MPEGIATQKIDPPRAAKASQRVPKGNQSEPKGPKGSQGVTKMHPKIDLRKRSKRINNGAEMGAKATKIDRKGWQSEPNGTQRKPKVGRNAYLVKIVFYMIRGTRNL